MRSDLPDAARQKESLRGDPSTALGMTESKDRGRTGFQPVLGVSTFVNNAISLVIPTEPSASGRRGINAKRFCLDAGEEKSLRVDPSAAR